jgi:hypothetical protein
VNDLPLPCAVVEGDETGSTFRSNTMFLLHGCLDLPYSSSAFKILRVFRCYFRSPDGRRVGSVNRRELKWAGSEIYRDVTRPCQHVHVPVPDCQRETFGSPCGNRDLAPDCGLIWNSDCSVT